MQLAAGTTLNHGKYLLNHVFDQQGIGWTYRATYLPTQQPLILKTLNPVLQSHPEFIQICQEFERRSNQWSKLNHPHLVKVLDFFYADDLSPHGAIPFVVMEAVAGMTLGDRLRRETLAESDIILLLRQLCPALTLAAESQGLAHGNLRPRTIIRRSDRPEYVLVGFAPSLLPSLLERSAAQTPYAAPELTQKQRGRNVDYARADLYSLGAVLYTCLTGHSPKLLPDGADLIDRLPLISMLKPGAARLLRSSMTSQVSDRPVSPEAWLAQLSARPTDSTPATHPPGKPAIPPTTTPPPSPASSLSSAQPDRPVAAASPTLPPTPSRPVSPAQTSPAPYRTEPLSPPSSPPQSSPVTLPPKPAAPTTQPPVPSSQQQDAQPKVRHRPATLSRQGVWWPARQSLTWTGTIAIAVGLLFGLVLRFQAAQRPGASLFHTGQSFPARDWKGTLTPPSDDLNDIPLEDPNSVPSQAKPSPSPSEKPTTAPPASENLPRSFLDEEVPSPTNEPVPNEPVPNEPVPDKPVSDGPVPKRSMPSVPKPKAPDVSPSTPSEVTPEATPEVPPNIGPRGN